MADLNVVRSSDSDTLNIDQLGSHYFKIIDLCKIFIIS